MENINKIIERCDLNNKRVENTFVLFRVDNSNNKFNNYIININSYKLIRYFEINKNMKSLINEIHQRKPLIDVLYELDKIKVEEIYKILKINNKIIGRPSDEHNRRVSKSKRIS